MIQLRITRKKKSFDFKYDETKNDHQNNAKNIYLDIMEIFRNGVQVFACSCQTVSNHPKSNVKESIAPGKFQVRLFCDRRDYTNPVHEIINAVDLEGETIDSYAMQHDAQEGYTGRWLIHDDWIKATSRPAVAPWSAGCIMMRTTTMQTFNGILTDYGCKSGDVIDAELSEL